MADVRRIAAFLFLDYRNWIEYGLSAVGVGTLALVGDSPAAQSHLDADGRASLYGSLAATSGALLGFVLAALAILVALPPTERLDALKAHPRWHLVPSSFFRSGRALLASLVIATLGIVVDNGKSPKHIFELIVAGISVLALVRVASAMVALDQVVHVANNRKPRQEIVDDP